MIHSLFIAAAGPSLGFIDGLGGAEMLLIFVIVLLLFGGDKLPEFARGLGKTMREFKKAASGVEEEFKRAMEEDERKRAATAIETPTPAGTPATPSDATPSTYPEDGSTDYSSEAGPVSPTAPDTTASPATTPSDSTLPAGENDADQSKSPAAGTNAAPTTPAPVVNEDYP